MSAFNITFNWRYTLMFVLLLPVMLSLGFWQLERAEQMRRVAEQQHQRALAQPEPVEKWFDVLESDAIRVSLTGRFLSDKVILMDNQIRHTTFGYEVIQPFLLSSGKGIVLVNRGWIAADPLRKQLPTIPMVSEELTLRGYIFQPSLSRHIEGAYDTIQWPLLIQDVELPRLQTLFERPLASFTVRLEGSQTAALTNDWPVVRISPAKHIAYAVQWFGLALVLMVLLVVVNTNVLAWLKHRRRV